MNKADYIFDALEMIDGKYTVKVKERNTMSAAPIEIAGKKGRKPRQNLVLVAVIAALLALCGFTVYGSFFDPWLQKPSAIPTETVKSAIENQIKKEYTITIRVDEIKIDEAETGRVIKMYSGSELAESRRWSDGYLAEHFVVVWAKYYVEYDHTKTFMNDGYTEQYFYLTEDLKTGEWTIADNTSPNT